MLAILSSGLLQIEPGLILWTVVIFLILTVVLKKLAWKPILAALDERENKIKESLEKADAAQKEAERMRADYETSIAQARQEAQELIAKGRKTAEATREEILQKARDEADAVLQRAKREIALEREKAVEEIKRTAGDLSVSIAAKIIGKSLSAQDHHELIQDALSNMRGIVGEPN